MNMNRSQEATGVILREKELEGIDISHYQGNIDWNVCTPENTGKKFIIHKATEGATYQDPQFIKNWRAMKANGFQVGAYHFLRFGSSEPKAQVDNFIKMLQQVEWDQNTILALDLEEVPGSDYSLVASSTEFCAKLIQSITGSYPYIYTRQNFWDAHVSKTLDIVTKCPLWIARWRDKPPSPKELPNGWTKWEIWQYSSEGKVPGITGNVDLNIMRSRSL
ncbi:hypothetical protein V9T40_011272 [Parthenolecanium corni]|uniref:Lysozyme n=1 Tax=Parthenolecanium corni TaxID=536013 RepID=A0AAN9TJP5_9HEMI